MRTGARTPCAGRQVLAICLGASLAALATSGCAAVQPPRELTLARAAYQHARTGAKAAEVPVELDEARRALVAAERRFEELGADPEVAGLAVVADRKAQRAESVARRGELERELARLTEAIKRVEVDRDARARKAEADARAETERKNRELEAAARARREAEERAQRAADALKKVASTVRSEPRGVVLTFAQGLLFAQEVTTLSAPARARLDELAAVLQRDRPGAKIVVEAHTDNGRSHAHSAGVTKAQSEAVKEYLGKKGVANVRAEAVAELRPLASNTSPEGRASNRRVEVVIEP